MFTTSACIASSLIRPLRPLWSERFTQAVSSLMEPHFFDLARGWPPDDHLPFDLVAKACGRMQSELLEAGARRIDQLQYGPSEGDSVVLKGLAAFLSKHYRQDVAPSSLFITSGVSHSIELAFNCLLTPASRSTTVSEVVLVEDPTYFLATPIFRERCKTVIGVPTDEQGPVPAALERILLSLNLTDESSSSLLPGPVTRPAVQQKVLCLYTVPTGNNPRGCTASGARRRALCALAERYNFHIIADEVYQLLQWPDQQGSLVDSKQAVSEEVPAMAMLSPKVISVASFSKLLCPGLRYGWIQCRDPFIHQRLQDNPMILSGGNTAHFVSCMVHTVLHTDVDAYIGKLCRLYEARSAALCNAVQLYLPNVRFIRPKAGYFVWLEFPPEVDVRQLLAIATTVCQVSFRCGIDFAVDNTSIRRVDIDLNPAGSIDASARADSSQDKEAFRHCVRVCFALNAETRLRQAIQRLAVAYTIVQYTVE